jgi:hypothetical protein
MIEKTEDLPSFKELDVDELKRLDSQNVTLARAIEEARTARDATIEIKGEMVAELERFRAAMRHEFKERKRKLDLHDILLLAGLTMTSIGIAVASHWAYSLIVAGGVFVSLSLIALFRPPVKE